MNKNYYDLFSGEIISSSIGKRLINGSVCLATLSMTPRMASTTISTTQLVALETNRRWLQKRISDVSILERMISLSVLIAARDTVWIIQIPNTVLIFLSLDTIRGVHYHLNNKKCGQIPPRNLLPVQPDAPHPSEMKTSRAQSGTKRNYLKFYRKENNLCVCLTCGSRYQSVHGMHNHLNLTKCGFGEKFKSNPKTNYTQFYRKEDEKLICNSCGISYSSMHGMHYHLNSTKCGYGAKDKVTPKRNYQDFYSKVDNSYICNHCQYKIEYLQGIHRHLRNCDGGSVMSEPGEKITIISPAPSELQPQVKLYKQVTVTAHTAHNSDADLSFIGHDQNL